MTPPIRKTLPESATPDPVQSSILGLRKTLEDVIAESAAYRREVEDFQQAQVRKDEARDRQRKRENSVAALVAIAICIPIVIMLGLLLQNLAIARDAQQASADARRTADTIEDCIVPTGKCYRDGSKRTGGAVVNLARVYTAIAVCQRTTVDVPGLKSCISLELRKVGIILPAAP